MPHPFGVAMPEISKDKILAGRKAVDAYREAHHALHSKPWHKGIPEEHTPLLEKLVADLEKIGITSTETEFEPRKTEILGKFFADSETQNIKDAGLEGKGLTANDRVTLAEMWH